MSKTIAFQGARGAYSEQAARKAFANRVNLQPLPEFADVFRAVKNNRVDFGVLPIENSRTGSIHQNFDLLNQYKVWICKEVRLPVQHALLGHKQASLKSIREVYSHPQALWQCHQFLNRLKKARSLSYFDTAGAAQWVREQDSIEVAAVASREAARHYGLKVLADKIQDYELNFTRFIVVQKSPPQRKSSARGVKTTLTFHLRSVPGALCKTLSVFALANMQLLKIESRPIAGKPWEYLFYIDFEGDVHSDKVQTVLQQMRSYAKKIRVLGCYPKARA